PDAPSLLAAVGRCHPHGACAADPQLQPGVRDAQLVTTELGFGPWLVHTLIDPNLAFLFFWLGLILIFIELLHPGLSVPGVFGTVFLISAFVEFGFLPVQVAGVVLLLASALFFLLALKHPGIGLPTIGGTVCLVLGGLL